MAANFEIEIVGTEYIPLDRFHQIWSVLGPDVRFSEHLVYPDLFFDRSQEVPFSPEDMYRTRAEGLLRGGHVLYYAGSAGGTVHIGAFQYMEEERFWRSSLWFDTQGRAQFDTDRLTPEVQALCDVSDRCLEGQNVLFYAMGVEMMGRDAASVLKTHSWPSALVLRLYETA